MKHGGIAEICRTGIAPGTRFRGGLEESDVDVMAPRAIKMLDNKTQTKLIKESGFSKAHIKRVWNMCVVAFLMLALSASAADITAGHVFTPGEQNITHVQMNAIVGSATINTAFFTAKSSGTPAAADVILFYSTGLADFRKATFQTALYNNTGLITTQTEDATPAPGDYILTYDVSAAGFKKVTLQNAVANGSTNAIASYGTITTPTLADFVSMSQSSTNGKATVTNLLALFNYKTPFTNLVEHTAPTNADRLLIWDSAGGANKWTTLLGLVTNLPTVAPINTNDFLLVINNRTNIDRTSLTNVGRALFKHFIFPGAFGAGASANQAHSFPVGNANLGFPQLITCTVQCNTAELGYAVGDNVAVGCLQWESGGTNAIAFGFNSTNVFYKCPTNLGAFPKIPNKATGILTAMDTNNWQVTIQAVYLNFNAQ